MILMSSHIIKINVFIINVIKNIIGKIIYICSYPLKLIYITLRKIFFKPISFIFINIRKKLFNIIKLTKNNKTIEKKA